MERERDSGYRGLPDEGREGEGEEEREGGPSLNYFRAN